MKRKGFVTLFVVLLALCCAFGVIGCTPTGEEENESAAKKFIRVMDAVFTSAEYTVSSSSEGGKTSSQKLTAQASEDALSELYAEIANGGNLQSLSTEKLKKLKSDSLYQGANLAALLKSMALTFDDNVFSTVYDLTKLDMPNSVVKLDANDGYTLYGVMRYGENLNAVQIEFKEYSAGKFEFKLVQYPQTTGYRELQFAYFRSDACALRTTLKGDADVDFSNYDAAYDKFTVSECVIVRFGENQYISENGNTADFSEAIMKFGKTDLNFSNQTYQNLLAIGEGTALSDEDVGKITEYMQVNRYIPYSYNGGTEKLPEVESIEIESSLELKVGESKTLSVTIFPTDAVYQSLTWESSDENVVTVTQQGKVTAVGEGRATVTVNTDNGLGAPCQVRVTKKEEDTPPEETENKVESIELDQTAITLYVNGKRNTVTLNATITPNTPEARRRVEWTIDAVGENYVGKVDSDGLEAIFEAFDGNGEATVTATVDGKSASCTVTTKRLDEMRIAESENSLDAIELEEGQTLQLHAYVLPEEDAEEYEIKWESLNEDVATVDEDGLVTAVSAGSAWSSVDIYAYVGDLYLDVYASAYIRVVKPPEVPVEVEEVRLSQTSLTIAVGDLEQLTATVLPANATTKTIVWTSSDESVATERYGYIRGVSAGTATLTATANNGVYAECTVTVIPKVALNKSSLTLEFDEDETLIATVASSVTRPELTWRSSNREVARVDQNGRVWAESEGDVTVTVTTGSGESATCSVRVVLPSEKRLAYSKIEEDGELVAYAVKGLGTIGEEEHVTVPATFRNKPVTKIGQEAFWDGTMKEITVSEGVRVIEDGAFGWCESLKKVYLPDSLEQIGGAFFKCTALEEISLPFIGESGREADNNDSTQFHFIFSYRGDYDVPDSLQKVTVRGGASVIHGVSGAGITEVHLPDDITEIRQMRCPSLKEIELPSALKKIGISAFSECGSLVNVTFPAGLEEIGTNAFFECSSLQEVILFSNLKQIGKNAFLACNSLQEMAIPFVGEKSDETGNRNFGWIFGAQMSSQNEEVVPASLKKVTLTGGRLANSAFANCTSLEEIILPEGLSEISQYAFKNCGLKKLVVPSSVTEIKMGALKGCMNLTELTVPFVGMWSEAVGRYTEDGVSYETCELRSIFGAKSASEVPATLEKVTVTSAEIYLRTNAFIGCNSIREIRFEGKFTWIEQYAFPDSQSLKDVYCLAQTLQELDDVPKALDWYNKSTGNSFTVHCSDGNISSGSVRSGAYV